MKEIQTNGIAILFVEVPEDAINIEIDQTYPDRICFDIKEDVLYPDYRMLPSGQYQILGKSTELSEEQMKEICEHCKMGYLNYKYPFSSNPSEAFTDSLQESYLSLLEANGIDNNKTNSVLKRI